MKIIKRVELHIAGVPGVTAIISIESDAETERNKASNEQDAMFIHEALLGCLPHITYAALAKHFANRISGKEE